MATDQKDCGVCCEAFNKSTRKPVKCGQCAFTVCTKCFEHYQTDHSGLYDVHCMSCKELWEDQFVRESVPAAVLNRLTASTKKRLRDEETAFMPETQMYVEYGRGVETVKLNEFLDTQKKINELQMEFAHEEMKKKPDASKKAMLREQIREAKHTAYSLKQKISLWRNHNGRGLSPAFRDIMPDKLYEKHYGNNRGHEHNQQQQGPPEPTVVCPCPAENCRGFVTRKTHTCGVCEKKVCGKCLMPREQSPDGEEATPHVCNESDIQTAEFVLKTSKPCPKCAARIHKIEGCDQMWCTNCATPFSWRTGQMIVGGVIHNPHYYEWMRSHNPNQQGGHGGEFVNNCEGLPEGYHLSRHLELVFREHRDFTNKIRSYHRMCVHHQQVDLPGRMDAAIGRGAPRPTDPFMRNIDIRLMWLTNGITDKAFETTLHKRFKSKIVSQRANQVYELVITLCSDVFHRILRTNDNTEEIRTMFATELRGIMDYSNTCFEKLEKTYNVSLPRVRSF